jgi:acetyl esterase/lipase
LRKIFAISVFLGILLLTLTAADEPAFTRTEDVIYGRKYGTALTMDVFTPAKGANGAAVIEVISGGWSSSHDNVELDLPKIFTDQGYTVFSVVHGSQPKFTIPEMIEDMHRCVRYIRHNAKKYRIDPDRIGITGSSAGGHLALMMGTAGDAGNPKAIDAVNRTASHVQAVACFFPPTDFLNYGEKGKIALGRGLLHNYKASFDFHEFDNKTQSFVPVTDEERILAIGRQISPVYHVSADDAPTLIVHGDADKVVPIQQAKLIISKLKDAGVAAELVVKKGASHGWRGWEKDVATFVDWFDRHLKKPGRQNE